MMCIQLGTLLDNVAPEVQSAALQGWETVTPKAAINRTVEEQALVDARREKYTPLFESCSSGGTTGNATECVTRIVEESTAERTADEAEQAELTAQSETLATTVDPASELSIASVTNAQVAVRALDLDDSDHVDLSVTVRNAVATTIHINLFELSCSDPLDAQSLCTQFVSTTHKAQHNSQLEFLVTNLVDLCSYQCCQEGMDQTSFCQSYRTCY